MPAVAMRLRAYTSFIPEFLAVLNFLLNDLGVFLVSLFLAEVRFDLAPCVKGLVFSASSLFTFGLVSYFKGFFIIDFDIFLKFLDFLTALTFWSSLESDYWF